MSKMGKTGVQAERRVVVLAIVQSWSHESPKRRVVQTMGRGLRGQGGVEMYTGQVERTQKRLACTDLPVYKEQSRQPRPKEPSCSKVLSAPSVADHSVS